MMTSEFIIYIPTLAAEELSWTDISTISGTFIALVGLIISLIYSIITHKASNKIQKDTLLHDMVKFEIDNWKYLQDNIHELTKGKREHIFNYYEYLAYLILRGKIDWEEAKTLWKPNIYGMYKKFKNEFLGNRKELHALYKKWKKEDEKI